MCAGIFMLFFSKHFSSDNLLERIYYTTCTHKCMQYALTVSLKIPFIVITIFFCFSQQLP